MMFESVLMPVALAVIGPHGRPVSPAAAQVVKDPSGRPRRPCRSQRASLRPAGPRAARRSPGVLDSATRDGWASFRLGAEHRLDGHVDRRSGRIEIAEGDASIPWIPGRGNKLANSDIAAISMARCSPTSRPWRASRAASCRASPACSASSPQDLVLNARPLRPAGRPYLVRRLRRALREVSRSRARASSSASTTATWSSSARRTFLRLGPQAGGKAQARQALHARSGYVGGFSGTDSFVDRRLAPPAAGRPARQPVRPMASTSARAAARPGLAVHLPARRRHRHLAARVDAETGEVLELTDINDYAQVTGGAKVLGDHDQAADRPSPTSRPAASPTRPASTTSPAARSPRRSPASTSGSPTPAARSRSPPTSPATSPSAPPPAPTAPRRASAASATPTPPAPSSTSSTASRKRPAAGCPATPGSTPSSPPTSTSTRPATPTGTARR